uniref:Putative sigma-70 region domain containing protein n=1 Tax=viral metagenome TaxID=1070528 RepID=A0A6M3JWI6_9ZZZZ
MKIREFINEQEGIERNFDYITEQMSGTEIAKELGVTRQAVSNILKRALKKFFIEVSRLEPEYDAFEVATTMAMMFNAEGEIDKFYKLFPPDIRKKIETDAKEHYPSQKK